jgi:diguanylate cyclase
MASEIETLLRGPKGYALARKAIDAMETNRVWPTALNFELWVQYVAAKNPALTAEIETVIRSGRPFTDEVGEQLAANHLATAKMANEILDAGESLTKELHTVSRAIETAREVGEAYGQTLATASEELEKQDGKAVKEMVDNLTAATRKVHDQNQALESQLADTTEELERLRSHLEQVRRDAMTDALTGLANRKAFDEAREWSCNQADLKAEALTLAIVDIDHF